MKDKGLLPVRLEWISLVYLALFVLAVLSPSLITKNFFGIPERHVEECFIFLFGLVGLATFSIYQRIMEKTEKEHEDAKSEYDRARHELVDSYRYIGNINRQMEVLKRLANQTSLKMLDGDQSHKDLLNTLLQSAAESAGAHAALIRYVDLERLQTKHEVLHSLDKAFVFKVPNKELRRIHEAGLVHACFRDDDGREIIIVPSDYKHKGVKAYLFIAPGLEGVDIDTSLLKVFVNQAEFLKHTLTGQEKVLLEPLELVKQAEKQVIGDVA
jgi:hypothetical protein